MLIPVSFLFNIVNKYFKGRDQCQSLQRKEILFPSNNWKLYNETLEIPWFLFLGIFLIQYKQTVYFYKVYNENLCSSTAKAHI